MNISSDLTVQDILDPQLQPVCADITIMNPSYMSWADLNIAQRRQLQGMLGSNYKGGRI